MQQSPKHIICTIDDNYAQHCMVMLQSLFDFNQQSIFNVHIITDGLSAKNITYFTRFFKATKHTFQTIKVDKNLLKDAPVFGHVSLATYFRILIPRLLPAEINEALFLDSDIIIKGNIDMFWQVNIANYSHIAIENNGISSSFKENLGIPQEEVYFNAGVLFINLQWWRANDVFFKSIDFMKNNSEKITFWDQDVLNALLYGKWLEFPPTYNAQEYLFRETITDFANELKLLEAVNNPVIIHFSGSDNCKPWYYSNTHKFKQEYEKYLAKTVFKDMKPIGFPEEKKLTTRDKFYLFRQQLFQRKHVGK